MGETKKERNRRILCLLLLFVFLLVIIPGTFAMKELGEFMEITGSIGETELLETEEDDFSVPGETEELTEPTSDGETGAETETETDMNEGPEETTEDTEDITNITDIEEVEETEETENSEETEEDENSEIDEDEEPTEDLIEEEIHDTGSISGFLWIDSDSQSFRYFKSLLYDETKNPLSDYPVYLYSAEDLSEPISDVLTDKNGAYIFEELLQGDYVTGLEFETINETEYLLPLEITDDNKMAIILSEDYQTAYSEIITIEEGQNAEGINAGLIAAGPSKAPNNEYIIDVTDYYNSLLVTGRGYSFDLGSGILTFNTDANGNDYTILRTALGMGSVMGIVFTPDCSPSSVTMIGLNNLIKGIVFPAGFNSDLNFQRNSSNDYVSLGSTTLLIPAGYTGQLGINGLSVGTLTFPQDYHVPLVFNGLTVLNALNYPFGYNEPIMIAGSFRVNGSQFPAGYTGPITIGGGLFTSTDIICRSGASIAPNENGIYLPNNISAITLNDATTDTNAKLEIRLSSTDTDFKIFLEGNSNIHGYITVPQGAKLTIDSAEATGRESGELKITTNSENACIGTNNTGDSGQIIINGGTVEATQTYILANQPAAIGGGAAHAGYVTVNGGKVIAKANANGAAIGGGAGTNGVGFVTVTGGTVIAEAGFNGAAIGGGNGSTGGFTHLKGSVILITGGTVEATACEKNKLFLGNSSYNGAGIGGGKDGFAEITIADGHVTANSGHGAGIGNGAGIISAGTNKGSIAIIGGSIRGYSLNAANIGRGFGVNFVEGYNPNYFINKEADILMYSRGYSDERAGVFGHCDGKGDDDHGDGYFVSLFFLERIRGDIYVYDATTSELLRVLPIETNDIYMTVLFSTGTNHTEDFKLFVDFYGDPPVSAYHGLRQIVHYYDHVSSGAFLNVKNPIIPSVGHMRNYPHNFHNAYWDTLVVAMDNGDGAPVFYRVTEKYTDKYGNSIPGKVDNIVTISNGGTYTANIPVIPGYIYKGYKLSETKPDSTGTDYTPGDPPEITNINENKTLFLVYAPGYIITERYIDIDGHEIGEPVHVEIDGGQMYSKTLPAMEGYNALGYIWDNASTPANYTPGNLPETAVSSGRDVYFIYHAVTTLSVSKTVAGAYGNRSKEFIFTIYFKDSSGTLALPANTKFEYKGGALEGFDGNSSASGMLILDNEGKTEFRLTHGQSITIEGIPVNCNINIVEKELVLDGTLCVVGTGASRYNVSVTDNVIGPRPEIITGDTGTWAMTQAKRVLHFTNTRIEVPETGANAGDMNIFTLSVFAAMSGLIYLTVKIVYKRRRFKYQN